MELIGEEGLLQEITNKEEQLLGVGLKAYQGCEYSPEEGRGEYSNKTLPPPPPTLILQVLVLCRSECNTAQNSTKQYSVVKCRVFSGGGERSGEMRGETMGRDEGEW